MDSGERPATNRDCSPKRELFRLSLYWLGLSSIFAGLSFILTSRLEFDGLVPNKDEVGRTLFLLTIAGAVIAMLVQPTVGTISDYTITRWGRRKPYILIGSILDVVVPGRHRPQPGPDRDRGVRGPAAVQLELRPGPVPGLRARSRAGAPGRPCQRARRHDADPRQRGRASRSPGSRWPWTSSRSGSSRSACSSC